MTGANVIIGLSTLQPLTSYSAVVAYTAGSGAPVFNTSLGDSASLAVAGGHIYANVLQVVRPIPLQTGRYLAAFDATTGAKEFVFTDENTPGFGPPTIANGVLFGDRRAAPGWRRSTRKA